MCVGKCLTSPTGAVDRVASRGPRDPILPPSCLYFDTDLEEFNSYTLSRSWMCQYLAYLRWYSLVASDPWITVDELLSSPFHCSCWGVSHESATCIFESG